MRAPCCDKMGLKRGPWTPEEDRILTSFIQRFGHGNWRALPKQAGLLRCGKSCRLRWKNYLRPDIKRGNFSEEEQETIIKLHQGLGNRWSAIAARLPGRTDNEIKNYWHTHLKKRLEQIRQIDNIGIVQELPIRPRDVKEEYSRVSKPAENINDNLITTTHHQGDTQILQQQPHIEASGNNPGTMSYAATTSNVMEFWYNVLMQAGNSREVKENLEQFAA